MRAKALGLDAEVEIRKRGPLYEVVYWWLVGEEQGAPPMMRYTKDAWVAKTLCESYPWACAGSREDVRAYIESPFSIPAIIWLTAVASITDPQRGREMLDFLRFESLPTAAFDLMFESFTLDPDCEQLMIQPQRASRLMRDVIELAMMAQRELKRMRDAGIKPPRFNAKKPVEVAVRDNDVVVRGLGVDIPLFTYKAADGKAFVETMCKYFDCTKADGGVAASAEGSLMEILLTWSVISMTLRKPYEYEDYLRALAISGVPDSAVHMVGYMLVGSRGSGGGFDELLLFKRKTAEVVRGLVDHYAAVRIARMDGCKRRETTILDFT